MFVRFRFSQDAKYFATASKDGSIKLWDAVSNRCVNTFQKAHDGAEVCSVAFTKNGKVSQILTSIKKKLLLTAIVLYFSTYFHLGKIL